MTIKDKIKASITKAVKTFGFSIAVEVKLELTGDFTHGDYTTNIALIYAKELGKNPMEFANEIKKLVEQNKVEEIEKIEVAGPGFINIFLNDGVFVENISKVLIESDEYGKNDNLKNQKTVIEFTDPNPFKEFHVGHLMTNTIGETLARIISSNGAEVKRINYQGDVGMHVAKTIWALLQKEADPTDVAVLARSYAEGSRAYEEDKEAKKEIVELNKKIYEQSDEKINRIYLQGKEASLKYFDQIYEKLDTHFDFNFFESQTAEFGKQLTLDFLKTGVFKESEGAVIYPGEKKGLHSRVFINSQGLPTYEAKELGLAKVKYDNYPYDRSIIVTGNEVAGYFKVLISAMSEVFPELSEKTTHIGHGMLRLPSGKMSSRTGSIIPALQFIEEVKDRVLSKMNEGEREVGNKEEVAEMIAIGAIKYSILKQDIGRDIIFDFDKSVSFEGNSGPYLQYTYTRIRSVIEKSGKKIGKFDQSEKPGNLERLIFRFPEILERAGNEMAPQQLATYLFELASEFSSFYVEKKIIDSDRENYRLALADAVGQVLKNGLWVLGIHVPDKM